MKEIQHSQEYIDYIFQNQIKKRFDNTDFLKSGKEVENEFFSHFPEHILATEYQNKFEHWDGRTERWKNVDVKGLGKISRKDGKTNEDIHFFEIRNILGKEGWGCSKFTNYIAFQTNLYFYMVELMKLQKFMEKKLGYSLEELLIIDINKLNLVKTSQESLYKLYMRKGQKDLISMMRTSDLILMSEDKVERKKIIL